MGESIKQKSLPTILYDNKNVSKSARFPVGYLFCFCLIRYSFVPKGEYANI